MPGHTEKEKMKRRLTEVSRKGREEKLEKRLGRVGSPLGPGAPVPRRGTLLDISTRGLANITKPGQVGVARREEQQLAREDILTSFERGERTRRQEAGIPETLKIPRGVAGKIALEEARGKIKGRLAGEARDFTTSEREAGQTFKAGERSAGQEFRTEERVAGQEFTKGESVAERQGKIVRDAESFKTQLKDKLDVLTQSGEIVGTEQFEAIQDAEIASAKQIAQDAGDVRAQAAIHQAEVDLIKLRFKAQLDAAFEGKKEAGKITERLPGVPGAKGIRGEPVDLPGENIPEAHEKLFDQLKNIPKDEMSLKQASAFRKLKELYKF